LPVGGPELSDPNIPGSHPTAKARLSTASRAKFKKHGIIIKTGLDEFYEQAGIKIFGLLFV
jgi:hypothetical protein